MQIRYPRFKSGCRLQAHELAGGVAATNVAKWDGSTWSSLGADAVALIVSQRIAHWHSWANVATSFCSGGAGNALRVVW